MDGKSSSSNPKLPNGKPAEPPILKEPRSIKTEGTQPQQGMLQGQQAPFQYGYPPPQPYGQPVPYGQPKLPPGATILNPPQPSYYGQPSHYGQPQHYSQPNMYAQPGVYGQQIQAQMMMPPQPSVPGVPLGLELLIPLNRIFIKQRMEMLEMFTSIESRNQYDVLNAYGQRIYFAQETTGGLELQCGGSQRSFKVNIIDFLGRTALVLYRLDSGCSCGSASMGINLMDGSSLGSIRQLGSCSPEFTIQDARGLQVMRILGDGSAACCSVGSADFPITTMEGQQVGVIRKTFAGFQEFVTDADNFGVEFNVNLDVIRKALMFAGVFLIDFMYYESSPHHRHHHNRLL